MPFRHAPYAFGKPAFAIGLAPIDVADWIEPDDHLAEQLAAKEAIFSGEGEAAFAALAGCEAGQAEVLELLAAHLPARFPELYRREAGALRVLPNDRLVALDGAPPLLTASRLVQEDLLLMRRADADWRLVAGSLCFPSSWRLGDKLGRPLEGIHAPAPGLGGRTAAMIARIFDNLKADQPVERFNWSIYGDGELRHAEAMQDPLIRFPPDEAVLDRAHVRVERQTLRRLPRSGDILFTVRVHIDPLAALSSDARGRALARALRDALAGLSAAQLAYKGLFEARGRLLAALVAIADSPGQ
jgi:hypothetical protein